MKTKTYVAIAFIVIVAAGYFIVRQNQIISQAIGSPSVDDRIRSIDETQDSFILGEVMLGQADLYVFQDAHGAYVYVEKNDVDVVKDNDYLPRYMRCLAVDGCQFKDGKRQRLILPSDYQVQLLGVDIKLTPSEAH